MSAARDTLVCPKFFSTPGFDDFDSALEMPLHYLAGPRELFLPGTARLAWFEDRLFVLATLHDADVYTAATADNQDMWDLGDVFEIFIRDQADEEYFELHTSSAGYRLQLRFPDAQRITDLRKGLARLSDHKFSGGMLTSSIRRTAEGWQALCAVRWPRQPMASRTALVSFSRYDYTQGQPEPVLSSTSLHQVVNYHRQEEWAPIVFAA